MTLKLKVNPSETWIWNSSGVKSAIFLSTFLFASFQEGVGAQKRVAAGLLVVKEHIRDAVRHAEGDVGDITAVGHEPAVGTDGGGIGRPILGMTTVGLLG